MASPPVSDDLWSLVAPLLPSHPPRPKGGRPPIPGRACLTGIVFVSKTGIQWEDLPPLMGCGSQAAGAWTALRQAVLDRLRAAYRIDWTRAAVDASTVPATLGPLRPARIRRIAAWRLPCIAGRPPHRARSATSGSTAPASRLGTAGVETAALLRRVVAVSH